MKSVRKPIILMLLMLLMLFVAMPAVSAESKPIETPERTYSLSVTGKGSMTITPDVAYVSLGVETRAKLAKDAQAENAKLMADIKKQLKTVYKLVDQDLKTSNFNVYPEYSYADKEAPKVIGYVASHMLTVTVRDLAKLGDLVDSVSEAGANRIHNIQFGTEKQEEYEEQLLEKAVQNAWKKANAIAKASKRTLVGVVNVSEGYISIPQAWGNYYSMNYAAAEADSAGKVPTSFESGDLVITANVNVQFEMK